MLLVALVITLNILNGYVQETKSSDESHMVLYMQLFMYVMLTIAKNTHCCCDTHCVHCGLVYNQRTMNAW